MDVLNFNSIVSLYAFVPIGTKSYSKRPILLSKFNDNFFVDISFKLINFTIGTTEFSKLI